MAKKVVLVVLLFLFIFPPALALNCRRYNGDYRTFCKIINPLPLSESYKLSLMNPSLYGTIIDSDQIPILTLVPQSVPPVTLESIYESKIIFIVKFFLFILFIYLFYSLLTKSSFIRKWLTAGY